MSTGVLNVKKYKKSDITNLQKNIEKDELLYHVKGRRSVDFKKSINDRVNALTLEKAVRKDAVVLVEVFISADKDFFDSLSNAQKDDFFRQCYGVLADRYDGADLGRKKDNIISATVHGGCNPHLRFCFVPITSNGRLAAKLLTGKYDLIKLHNDFEQQIWKCWGLGKKQLVDLEKENGQIRNEKAVLIEENTTLKADIARLEAENIEFICQSILYDETKELKDEKAILEANNNQLEEEFQIKRKNFIAELTKILNEKEEAKISLSEDQIQAKMLKDDISHLEKEKESLKQAIKDLRINLGLIHGLEPAIRKKRGY